MDGCELHHLGQVCSLKGDLEVLGPSVLEAHLALGLSPRVDLNASPIPVSAREGGPSEDWAPLKAFSGRENLGLVTLVKPVFLWAVAAWRPNGVVTQWLHF